MIHNEFDIRLLKVDEISSKSRINRLKIMRYGGEAINVDLQGSINPFLNDNILILELGVYYMSSHNDKQIEYLRYFINLKYEIPNLLDIVETNDFSVILPSYMLSIMMSVGIGSLRGMLAKTLSHTRLCNYPLPIMNVSEIIHSLHLNRISNTKSNPLFQFVYE